MNLGPYIRELRQRNRLGLRELARRSGVDVAHLSRVEAGASPASDELLKTLERILSTPEGELALLAGKAPLTLTRIAKRDPRKASLAVAETIGALVREQSVEYSPAVESSPRLIEDGFPFAAVSKVAEMESWRKEINRPIYHLHKWWAQRLGSVFRAAVIGGVLPAGAGNVDLLYAPFRFPGITVFDPFMGSGTTIGEAHKLGCKVIGRDINPVAVRTVRAALGKASRNGVLDLYNRLESTVGERIRNLYRRRDSTGNSYEILYFFWVKYLPCPGCGQTVDLFSTYTFAAHAYPKKNPRTHSLCPHCGEVNQSTYQSKSVLCHGCGNSTNPTQGPVHRDKATCQACHTSFRIAHTARQQGRPPLHRLYAKLVLSEDGEKRYLRADGAETEHYQAAQRDLAESGEAPPAGEIEAGHNTNQVLNYGYSRWSQFFNDRQLFALCTLAQGIRSLPACPEREVLEILFSGTLEFNNMFASYKGEGTGAVRHMFAHHVLKPERTPLEANVWGTSRSSGSFSTLFKSRVLRAFEYKEYPFELAIEDGESRKKARKIFGVSGPMGGKVYARYPRKGIPDGGIYISCGDSAKTDLPDRSVDLVVTDPPFFDNVHYSELADFFFVWQQAYFSNGRSSRRLTTRSVKEVQDTDSAEFSTKLAGVFSECNRVLKDTGLLIFSYHHSRNDGWIAVAEAVKRGGFSIVSAQPVKAEMAVAMPKNQAKSPINIDVLLTCKKEAFDRRTILDNRTALRQAIEQCEQKVDRFNASGRLLSHNDLKVVLFSELMVVLSCGRGPSELAANLLDVPGSDSVIERIWTSQTQVESSIKDESLQIELL